MIEVKIQNNTYNFDKTIEGLFLNQNLITNDIRKISDFEWHVIIDNKSYSVFLVDFNEQDKIVTWKINNKKVQTTYLTELDILLKSMGFENSNVNKVTELKAPMPGLIRKIIAVEGQKVLKGDAILVLEAMKMENIIKAQADGTIASIKVKDGDIVDKNYVMVKFE